MGRLTAEELASAEFSFREEEVEVPQLGGSILLRELSVGRRSKLLEGLTDKDGNVTDVYEVQVRTFSGACVDPQLDRREVRKFLSRWPSTVIDSIFEVINEKLGGVTGEEEQQAAAEEFPGEDD